MLLLKDNFNFFKFIMLKDVEFLLNILSAFLIWRLIYKLSFENHSLVRSLTTLFLEGAYLFSRKVRI